MKRAHSFFSNYAIIIGIENRRLNMYNIKEKSYAFIGLSECFMRNALKRIFAFVFAALMLGALGCRGRSTIGPVFSEEPGGSPVLTDAPSPAPTDTAAPEVTDEPTPAPTAAPTISGQVLFDGEGLKITADELVFDAVSGPGVCISIENGMAADIELTLNALIVNGYMLTELFYSAVYAGTVEKETVYLEPKQLELAGIDVIRIVEMSFHAAELDTHVTLLDSERVAVKTSLYDEKAGPAEVAGKLLFEGEGVRVTGVGMTGAGLLGPSYVVCIENTGGVNITLTCENVTVNGEAIKPVFYYDVFSDTRAMGEMTFLSADLKKLGIEEIGELSFSFRVWKTGTFETVAVSDRIDVSIGG